MISCRFPSAGKLRKSSYVNFTDGGVAGLTSSPLAMARSYHRAYRATVHEGRVDARPVPSENAREPAIRESWRATLASRGHGDVAENRAGLLESTLGDVSAHSERKSPRPFCSITSRRTSSRRYREDGDDRH